MTKKSGGKKSMTLALTFTQDYSKMMAQFLEHTFGKEMHCSLIKIYLTTDQWLMLRELDLNTTEELDLLQQHVKHTQDQKETHKKKDAVTQVLTVHTGLVSVSAVLIQTGCFLTAALHVKRLRKLLVLGITGQVLLEKTNL